MNSIKKIIDLLKRLELERFTGTLVLKIVFNQGGIRTEHCKKSLEDKI